MKTIEERVTILEKTLKNLQDSFIQAQKNNAPDVAKTEESYNKIPQINENTEVVNDNSLGLFDVASLADENSQAIMELAEMIAEMEG